MVSERLEQPKDTFHIARDIHTDMIVVCGETFYDVLCALVDEQIHKADVIVEVCRTKGENDV